VAKNFSMPGGTVEAKPVSYIVGVDEANLKVPVRFMRMSDGSLYRLKHPLARDGNETAELAIKEGSVIRGVTSGIVYRFLAERPYTDPAVIKAAWDASQAP
jgi:hypothetical protein